MPIPKIPRGICFFLIFLLSLACGSAAVTGAAPSATPIRDRISFPGVGAHGIFDPSLALDPQTERLWMSYSAVDPSADWPERNRDAVSIRLAYSDDRGGSWTDSGEAASGFQDVTIPLDPPNNAGTWVSEVSTLVHDPGAAAGERWKIFWHHYLIVNGSRRFEHGWIAMKAAPRPEDLAAAPEQKLFAGHLYDAGNDTSGGGSRSPVGGAPWIQLDTALSPDLKTCVFTEPGLYASDAALYLSLQCEHLSDSDRLIVLLACASPCKAESAAAWTYLGTVLRKTDAAPFGFDGGFAAPALFFSSGSVYLTVTPVQTRGAPWPDYYSGCRLFRFSDLGSALLQKKDSRPDIIGAWDGSPGSFNGACAFHPAAAASGMLYSELDPSVPDKFRIFMSHILF